MNGLVLLFRDITWIYTSIGRSGKWKEQSGRIVLGLSREPGGSNFGFKIVKNFNYILFWFNFDSFFCLQIFKQFEEKRIKKQGSKIIFALAPIVVLFWPVCAYFLSIWIMLAAALYICGRNIPLILLEMQSNATLVWILLFFADYPVNDQ